MYGIGIFSCVKTGLCDVHAVLESLLGLRVLTFLKYLGDLGKRKLTIPKLQGSLPGIHAHVQAYRFYPNRVSVIDLFQTPPYWQIVVPKPKPQTLNLEFLARDLAVHLGPEQAAHRATFSFIQQSRI